MTLLHKLRKHDSVIPLARKISALSKQRYFPILISLIGLVPLTLIALVNNGPGFRLLAVVFLVLLILMNFYFFREPTNRVDDQVRLATQRQRYLIAVEIHQTVSQMLFAATLISKAMLANENAYPNEIVTDLKNLRQLASTAHLAIRHILLGHRPTHINQIPLDRLITELVQIKRMSTESDIQCMAVGTASYPPDIHLNLYRIVDLALSNSVLHAQASHILVCLFLDQDEAIVTVEDNGCGFDHTERKGGHYGLEDIDTCARDIGAMLDWNTLPGPDPKKITCIWRRPSWN